MFGPRNDGGFQRQMYQGNWKCADCGTEINELPFEPNPEKADQLRCRDCFRKGRPARPRGDFQRRTYQGNWKCSKCGTEITELPFEPRPDRIDQLQCRDCFRQR